MAVAHHDSLKGGLFGDEEIYVLPCSLADAQRLVHALHRHHGKVAGHKFSLKASIVNSLRVAEAGAVIIGRPVSRRLDDGETLEITRLVTNGTPNIASKLLGAAAREAKRRGAKKIITYTLADESGVSLKAAGFTPESLSKGGSWNSVSRPRVDRHPTGPKIRWSKILVNCLHAETIASNTDGGWTQKD